MKILFITEQFPYPLHDGGNLRTYHVLRGLAERHDVCLLSHQPKECFIDTSKLPGVARCVTVPKPTVAPRLISNGLKYGLRGYPLFVVKNWSSALLARADKLLSGEHFDAIHLNHLDTACFALRRAWPQLKVFDSHNCLSELARQVSRENSSWLRRSLYARESRCLAAMEREVCRRMDILLTCSEDDAQAFRRLGDDGKVVLAPNGVDTDYFENSAKDKEQPGGLVFTGAMNYYPNEQAALFFCRDVMPLLQDREQAVRLFLVGKAPPASVSSLHNDRSVVVTGRVEDVRPYVHRAQVVVVPLRHGSGTRLKILEAFAMGKPVVSTTQGAEGIPAVDGQEILLADDPQSFARQVQRLLDSADLRSQVGAAARQFVEAQFDWRQIDQIISNAYSQLPDASPAHVD